MEMERKTMKIKGERERKSSSCLSFPTPFSSAREVITLQMNSVTARFAHDMIKIADGDFGTMRCLLTLSLGGIFGDFVRRRPR